MMPGMPVPNALELARELVMTPIPSGEEAAAAEVLTAAMLAAGFDETYVDDVGNAIGVIARGAGPKLLLTGHLATVPLGDPEEWPHPPLSGAVDGGRLWGRGSVDMKSALACMVAGAAQAAERGFRSEEHTSELQSRPHLVCRLLLEKKNKRKI